MGSIAGLGKFFVFSDGAVVGVDGGAVESRMEERMELVFIEEGFEKVFEVVGSVSLVR